MIIKMMVVVRKDANEVKIMRKQTNDTKIYMI